MKISNKEIWFTIGMLALSAVVILFTKIQISILGYSIALSDILLNLILIIDTLYCGLLSGILLAIIIPVLSFILTASSLISSVPLILPCLMIGNAVFVLFAWLARGKKLELNLMPVSLVAGSFAKAGIMTLVIVNWVLPHFNGMPYLLAGIVGTFFACVIWPLLTLGLKKIK